VTQIILKFYLFVYVKELKDMTTSLEVTQVAESVLGTLDDLQAIERFKGLNPDLVQGLTEAIAEAQTVLSEFSSWAGWREWAIAFGDNFDRAEALTLVESWGNGIFEQLPAIEIRAASELNNAYGAFAAATNTIYLSKEFLIRRATHIDEITSVVLEEIGHFVDAHINSADTPGDEGAIFSAVVQQVKLNDFILQPLRIEDDTVVLTLDRQTLQLEQATPGVNAAFDLIGLTQLRNDPRFASIDGSGFSVAVIDTGLDASHPLIQPNFRAFVDFRNGSTTPIDIDQHGTHVAGSVGSIDENIGVAPGVGLIGLQVFQNTNVGPRAPNTNTEAALRWVLDNHEQYNITAVNMSLGSGFFTSEAEAAGNILIDDVQRLEAAGITVVAAAGNLYKANETPNFGTPAIFSTLSVGAVWQDDYLSKVGRDDFRWDGGSIDFSTGPDRLTSFTQRLAAPNTIFAPGAMINSTIPGGGTALNGGTSMASPIVAGAVALMQEAAQQFGGRLLDPSEIVDIIRSTANGIFDGDDEDDNVQNTSVNYPRLNIFNAVEEIQRRFQQLAPNGDPNGTIEGAFRGPSLNGDGNASDPISGAIGTDFGTTLVGDKDVDMLRFEVLAPGNVTLEHSTNTANPADFDSFMRLFNANGTDITSDDDTGTGTFAKITTFLNPGVYYVGTSGFSNTTYNPNVAASGTAGQTGNYTLTLTLDSPDPNGLISGAVAINLPSNEAPVLTNGLIGADYGKPVGVSDVDLFEIVMPDNGTLFVDIDTPFATGEFVDSYLRLFDAAGNAIAFSDDNSSDEDADDGGHFTDSFLGASVERGGTYYIGVSDFDNQNYDPNNLDNRPATGTGGLYNLFVNFISNDLNGSIPQALDSSVIPLPITGQPGTIGADANFQTGELVDVGDRDVDFVKINSPTAGILEIDIDAFDNTTVSEPVDSVVLLFDANGSLLALQDDTAGSFDPLLQYEISANTDYFVAITGYGNSTFDPFLLGSGSSGDVGQYIFNSRVLSSSQAVVLSNDAVGNGAVQTVIIDSVVSAQIGQDNGFVIGADDIDIYRFMPTTSGVVNIRTDAFESYNSDTYLRFFDANGIQIAANDNATVNTRGSFVQVTVTAGATYLIGVNGASLQAGNYNPITGAGAANGSLGDYTLSLSSATGGGGTGGGGTGGGGTGGGGTGGGGTIQPTNQTLIGTGSGESLVGGEGNDRLQGLGGNDVLVGGGGADQLTGDLGSDTSTGGAGADRFIFSGASRTAAFATSRLNLFDRITDFSFSQGDKIQLDLDSNLLTPNLPKKMFNAGREKGQSLEQAVRSAYADKNQKAKGNQALKSNEAVLFNWRSRSFIAVNDTKNKFSAGKDFLVEVTGIEAQLGLAQQGVLSVQNYFA